METIKGDVSDGAKKPISKPVPFYSLYMHMMPTGWPTDPDDPYQDIPWLRRFFLFRHGAVVNLDSKSGPIGRLSWATNKIDIDKNKCTIYEDPADFLLTQERKLRDGNRYLGYVKVPQGDMVQAYEALGSGAVVTFSGPFLPVEHGEMLGFLRPQSETHEQAGWLHWEFLAPAARESAIKKVWDLAHNHFKLDLPQVSEVGAQKQDNLLEADEVKSLLLEKLPMGDDRKLFQYVLPAIKERNYDGFRSAMSRFMSELSKFAHQPMGQKLVRPEFETRNEQELKRLATQLYTVTLEIDNTQYRVTSSSKNPAPYRLGLIYRGESIPNLNGGPVIARASVELTEADLAKDKIELNLQVPASAVAIEIDCPHFHLDSGASGGPVDTSLAQAFIDARWRGLVLKHASEWSPAGLDTLVRRLCEHDLMDTPPGGVDKAVEAVRPSSWYGVDLRKTKTPNAPVEVPILGTDGNELSLFDESKGMLPVKNGSGEVLNVHPVTFLWLLKLMQKGDLCSLVTEFKPDLSEEGKEGPLFWGWFPHETRPRRVGESLSVVSLRRDWGSGPVTLVAERLDAGPPGTPRVLELATGSYADGVFSSRVAPWFWGQWTLKVKGHEGESPQPQGGIEPPVSLHVLPPRLARTFEPKKDARTGLYSAELHFIESCPEALGGYLTYAFTKVPHPADKEFPQAEKWLLDADTAGYIEGLKKGEKNVTAHYTLSDYLGVSEGAQRVSVELCKVVERFRKACRVVLRVIELSEDGHTAMLEARGPAKLGALLQCAEQQAGAFDTSIEAQEVELEVGRKKKVIQLKFTATRRPLPLVWQEASCCNNVYATRVPPDDGAFNREGDFLTGLKSAKAKDARVSAHYSWSQYRKAAGGGAFKLSRHLADQLEALRSGVNFKVFIQALSADGLTVGVHCEKWKKNKGTLQAHAALLRYRKDGREEGSFLPESLVFKKLPLPGEAGPEGLEVLVLTVKPPPLDTSGWLRFEFDPRDIFAELLRQATPAPNERVWLKASFVAPNCYQVEHYEGPSRTPVPTPQGSTVAESLKAEVEGVFKTLALPGFEGVRLSVAGQSLSIQVPLRGRREDWSNAKPAISVDGTEQLVKPSAAGLVWTLPLSSNKPDTIVHGNKEKLSIKAYITNGDALFDGERIGIEPVSWEGNTIPRLLGPLMAEAQPGKVTLRARVYCCPTRAPCPKLRYTVVSEQLPPVGSKRKKQRPTQGFVTGARISYTGMELDGLFEAEFPTRPGESYHFELVSGGADGKLLGAPMESLHLDYTAPVESH
ncbi:hypothetical protein ACN28E_50260 [Archangium lansingense]|uniref:hypothetical protein n=1 Tax=Archangium lansingense TaxID=2995310 RepID=UPI003B78D916